MFCSTSIIPYIQLYSTQIAMYDTHSGLGPSPSPMTGLRITCQTLALDEI